MNRVAELALQCVFQGALQQMEMIVEENDCTLEANLAGQCHRRYLNSLRVR
jgi:hypothetical protein